MKVCREIGNEEVTWHNKTTTGLSKTEALEHTGGKGCNMKENQQERGKEVAFLISNSNHLKDMSEGERIEQWIRAYLGVWLSYVIIDSAWHVSAFLLNTSSEKVIIVAQLCSYG